MSDARLRVSRYAISDPGTWEQVNDLRIYLNTVVNRPGAEMTVGFVRIAEGETFDFIFPYDEPHVVTAGRLAIRIGIDTVTLHPGELIYYPAGAPAVGSAEQDTEMVYVANPPSWKLTEADWELAASVGTSADGADPPDIQTSTIDRTPGLGADR